MNTIRCYDRFATIKRIAALVGVTTGIAAGLLLGGCVVASAVDLAATTVFTVGKIAVKTTGAVVDAVIPDGNDDKDKKESKSKARKSESPPPPSTADYHPATPVYQPAPANTAAVDTAQ